ncbi:MAG: NAD(P)-dependent alcohol dehydrogenase [Planctomycetes bacterium]|nr:NAD(P)-dependent alcohol dehydrogenase [Planctomycetota bacterium]MCB9917042.1 NAD(P)-dependent alcohol dehydrogenase [Planctomycetota bacterium]
MRAAWRTRYGPPESIRVENVAIPEPGPGEVRVRVRATTVNRTDCAILRAKPFVMHFVVGFTKPKRPILGTDFAGEIDAIGDGVIEFAVGDRVFGFEDNGASSQAEFLVLGVKRGIAKIPDGIDFETAAASIEGAHYAINFLNKVESVRGRDVLVNGATGAIGSAMVQLAKHAGARVVAVCRSEHEELARSLGADSVIDYEREDFTNGPKDSYDFVFDTVGKKTFARARHVLRKGGTYISSELGPFAQNPILALTTRILGSRKVKFPVPLDIPRSLEIVRERLTDQSFRPVIDRRFPLSDVSEAYRYAETGQKVGNVVLTI